MINDVKSTLYLVRYLLKDGLLVLVDRGYVHNGGRILEEDFTLIMGREGGEVSEEGEVRQDRGERGILIRGVAKLIAIKAYSGYLNIK